MNENLTNTLKPYSPRQRRSPDAVTRLETSNPGRYKGIAAIVASAFGFAMMAACVRLCDDFGEPVPCFEKAFFRNLIAVVIAAVAAVRDRKAISIRSQEPGYVRMWLTINLRSILGTIGIFANFYALSHIPIADGQTLNKLAPFFTVLFAWLFLGERVSARQIGAVLLAFVGTLLVVRPGFAGDAVLPLAMGVLGGMTAGGAYAALRSLGRQKVPPAFIILYFSLFSCVASLAFMKAGYVPLSAAQVVILLGAGLFATIGQFGITFAYRFAAPKEIAVYDYTSIIFAAALGYLLFGQISDALSFAGMAVIILAAVFAFTARRSPD